MMRAVAFAAALLLLTAGAAVASCLPAVGGAHMKSADTGPFVAAVRLNTPHIKVGAPFTMDVNVCSVDGAKAERLVIDARMPAHRHGMNYKPEIAATHEGGYQAKGFLFHMPGKWEIMLSVFDAASRPQHFTLDLDVR